MVPIEDEVGASAPFPIASSDRRKGNEGARVSVPRDAVSFLFPLHFLLIRLFVRNYRQSWR